MKAARNSEPLATPTGHPVHELSKKAAVGVSLLLASCAFALTAGRAAATTSGSMSETTKVRVLLVNQTRLFNQSRWRPMYRTYAPRVRSRCPYPRFVAELKAYRVSFGRLTLRNVRVRVSGRQASATYQQVASGKVVSAMTRTHPDKFVRIGDRWFDDFDSGSPCSTG